jgi:nicotinate-nucleotide adenylyltransferase
LFAKIQKARFSGKIVMRLGIFGGTFDPVHLGHLVLAESCREACRLDRVLFLPSAVAPHKSNVACTPSKNRVEMLELATAGNEHFTVSRHETDRGGVNYTVDTLRHFRREMPEAELFFLMGADMLGDLPNWREAAVVCELSTVVAVRRGGLGAPGFDCLAKIIPAERIEIFRRCDVEMPSIETSGTDIRRRIAEGRSIRYLTPAAVEQYILSHGLYARE